MTQPPLFPDRRASFHERIRRAFLAHPGEWLDGLALARIGGAYGWRTRVSEVRRRHRMPIENRLIPQPDGSVRSQYRYVPENQG